MNKVILTIVLSSLLFACGSAKLTEEQRMQNEIRRDVPFQLDSLKSINNDCWSFASNGIITVEPDYEIRDEGSLWVYHTFFDEPKQAQQSNIVWRNLFVKKRKHRIICVDRVLIDKKTKGIIYILQSRNKSYASCGHYNWDVTRLEHLELVGSILEDMKNSTLKRFNLSNSTPKLMSSDIKTPSSQDDYLYVSTRTQDVITVLHASGKDVKRIQVTSCAGKHPRDFVIVDDDIIVANRFSDSLSVLPIEHAYMQSAVSTVTIPEGVSIIMRRNKHE